MMTICWNVLSTSCSRRSFPVDLDDVLRVVAGYGKTHPIERVVVITDGNLADTIDFELPVRTGCPERGSWRSEHWHHRTERSPHRTGRLGRVSAELPDPPTICSKQKSTCIATGSWNSKTRPKWRSTRPNGLCFRSRPPVRRCWKPD